MAVLLTSDDLEILLDQAISSMPSTRSDQHQQQMEIATETAVRSMVEPLMHGKAPNLLGGEELIIEALHADSVPPWLVRSRMVLVFRDLMRDDEYRRAFDTLDRASRHQVLADWAHLAADLYVSYPDKQISGRPELAVTILSGDDPELKHFLAQTLNVAPAAPTLPISGAIKNGGLLSRLTGRKKDAAGRDMHRPAPTVPAPMRTTTNPALNANRSAQGSKSRFNPQQGIKRVSGAQRLAMTLPQRPAPVAQQVPSVQQAEPAQTAVVGMAQSASKPSPAPAKKRPAPEMLSGPEGFTGRIQEQFNQRGLPPVSVGIATEAARIMVQSVLNGRVPDFHEVEYEVMVRQGDGIAAGAVRTWTIHAFMECMREPWFRDRYNALPSQARSEAVWTWAKLAADWFDVPEKMREFWVRSLSGGDPVLAAAVSRAFAARATTAPQPKPQAISMPAAINQLVEELEQREAATPAELPVVNEAALIDELGPMTAEPVWQKPASFKPMNQPAMQPVGGLDRRPPRPEQNLSFPRPLNGPRMRASLSGDNGMPGHMPLGAAEIRYSAPE